MHDLDISSPFIVNTSRQTDLRILISQAVMKENIFSTIIAMVVLVSSAKSTGLPHILKLDLPAADNCIALKVYHRGIKIAQIEGQLLLEQENKTNLSSLSKDANNTAVVSNATCVLPEVSTGEQYNWWQVLLQSGGKPGTLKELTRKNKSEAEHYVNPCERPLYVKDKDEFVPYQYKDSDLRTFYREENAQRRFPESPHSFVEVSGRLVWVPPPELDDKRGYNINYSFDDSGLWVTVWNDGCSFSMENGKPSLECSPIPYCNCDFGQLVCEEPISLNGNLLASLVG